MGEAMLHVVYVVTGSHTRTYLDMTYLSARVLRHSNPGCRVTVCTDAPTHAAIENTNHPLASVTDELMVCEVPAEADGFNSRYLKTRLRMLIKGDFLYLDSDTLPVRPLDAIAMIAGDFAAVLNWNREGGGNYAEREADYFRAAGLRMPEHYVNGGVLFWRDTPGAHALGRTYRRLWDEGATTECYYDQPTLNAAIASEAEAFGLTLLSGGCNAQYPANIRVALDAALWHGYSSGAQGENAYLAIGMERLRRGEAIDDAWVQTVCDQRLPYRFAGAVAATDVIDRIDAIQAELDVQFRIEFELSVRLLKRLERHRSCAVFGRGLSGRKTLAYLQRAFPGFVKLIIDDGDGADEEIEVVSTRRFLDARQTEVELVVYGRHQTLNPELLPGLRIPDLRLENII